MSEGRLPCVECGARGHHTSGCSQKLHKCVFCGWKGTIKHLREARIRIPDDHLHKRDFRDDCEWVQAWEGATVRVVVKRLVCEDCAKAIAEAWRIATPEAPHGT